MVRRGLSVRTGGETVSEAEHAQPGVVNPISRPNSLRSANKPRSGHGKWVPGGAIKVYLGGNGAPNEAPPTPDGSGKPASAGFSPSGWAGARPGPGQGAGRRMDGMFAYGGTDRVGDAEALPLEMRWPAFAELLARGRARGRVTRDEFEA